MLKMPKMPILGTAMHRKDRNFSSQSGLKALGRLKAGEMNKTEAAYAASLEERCLAGDVLSWQFEAVTLAIGGGVRYTPDFMVMTSDREIQFHEVKGSRAIFEDDAKVKFKVAASAFPMFHFFVAFSRSKSSGGGFDVEEAACRIA